MICKQATRTETTPPSKRKQADPAELDR